VKNLEIKARCKDVLRAHCDASSLGIEKQWTVTQKDTYFQVLKGKLKLREVDGFPAELIAYSRTHDNKSKISQYEVFRTDRPQEISAILSRVLPVELIVEKERSLYLWESVRIHIDIVKRLGAFIEFEAPINKRADQQAARPKLDHLIQTFNIQDQDLVAVGYYELLKSANRKGI
jgi:adenylate cyclase class 2